MQMTVSGRWIAVWTIALGSWTGAWMGVASAAPMSPEACELAKAEHKVLVDAGIPEIVKKGPAAAKASATASQIKDVERYIGLQEQLQFRCGLAKLRELPIVEDDATDPAAPAAAASTKPPIPAAAVPPVAPKAKSKPKSAASAERAKSAAKPAQAKKAPQPATKQKAQPKPKTDDAYRPPAKAETSAD